MSTVLRIDRALVALAAPSWRARYADEFGELLTDTPAGASRTSGVAFLVVSSWVSPSKHLHSSTERLRATLMTHLMLFFTLVAASTLYRFSSVDFLGPNQTGSAVVWAHVGRRCVIVAPLVLAVGFAPLVVALIRSRNARGRNAHGGNLTRPLAVAATLVVVGSVTLALTPRLSRRQLEASSLLVVPVLLILLCVPAAGVAVQNVLAGLWLHRAQLAVAVALSWLAVMINGVGAFGDMAMREDGSRGANWGTASYLRTWQAYMLLLLVITAAVSTISIARAATTAARHRPALAKPAAQIPIHNRHA